MMSTSSREKLRGGSSEAGWGITIKVSSMVEHQEQM